MPTRYTHGKQQLEVPVKRSLISSLESAYRNAWYNEDYLRNFHFNGGIFTGGGSETCLVRITSTRLNRNILLVFLVSLSLKSVTVINQNNHVLQTWNIIIPSPYSSFHDTPEEEAIFHKPSIEQIFLPSDVAFDVERTRERACNSLFHTQ